MGRAPCCDKANVKRGPWSPEEDSKLKAYIELHGTGGNWIALPQNIGLKRCGKSCRLRWLNYLRPNIKHGGFSEDEDNIICALYLSIGSRWSIIAAQLPGRTDNDIKNYWNTRLKKKLLGKQRREQQASRASFFRQEMKMESYDNNAFKTQNEATANQTPYWPEIHNNLGLPMTSYLHKPSFEDQESIKKLLTKLGGNFCESGHQYYSHQPNMNMYTTRFSYPVDNNTSWIQESQLYQSPVNCMVANSFTSASTSTSTTNSINENYTHQQHDNNYNNLSGSHSPNTLDVGLSELDELLYYINSNESESFAIESTNNGTHGLQLLNYQNFQESGELQYPICEEARYYVGCQ